MDRHGLDTIEVAIESLAAARAESPNNPGIANDLGVAMLLRATVGSSTPQSRSEDIAQAVEILRDAIKVRPSAELFYNLALAYEAQESYTAALNTWNRFLELEPTGGWAAEAIRHIGALQARQQARMTPGRRRSEDAITGLAAQGFQSFADINASSVSQDLMSNHGDAWLKDLLQASGARQAVLRSLY